MKNEEKRKIMEFVKDQYFGCIDVKSEEEKYYPGDLLSESDKTTILMIPNVALSQVLNKLEFGTMYTNQTRLPFSEDQIRLRVAALDQLKQIKRIAIMNATNTNVVPIDNRGLGLYLDMSAKKVQKWVTHFEGKRSKSVLKPFINPAQLGKKSDTMKRQDAFIAPGQVMSFQSKGTVLSKQMTSPFKRGITLGRASTLKRLKSNVTQIDDELYDEEEHYYDEIDVLVEHIDQENLKRKITSELQSIQRQSSLIRKKQQKRTRQSVMSMSQYQRETEERNKERNAKAETLIDEFMGSLTHFKC